MAINKAITIDSTGVSANYHVIQQISIDLLGKTTSAAIMSYVSKDTYAAGKQPVQSAFSVFVKGVPGDSDNAVTFLQDTLIAAEPETPDPSEAALPYYVNRYVFAGGTIDA